MYSCATRAYLLYLVGCTLFSDKSGTRVFVEYLQLFEKLGQISSYVWGAAALTYQYRQLGYASRGGIKQIARYMPLLEVLLKISHRYLYILCEYTQCIFDQYAWIYEHSQLASPS